MTTHVVVMGVSGSGKSTLGGALAGRLGWVFAEADDFHPPANIAKMTSGVPLTDEDRWPWLCALGTWMADHEAAGESTVITCSALRRSYRDLLRGSAAGVVFVHLSGDPGVITERMSGRSGHFMPTSLLESQLETLEALGSEELRAGSVVLDLTRSPEELVDAALAAVDGPPRAG